MKGSKEKKLKGKDLSCSTATLVSATAHTFSEEKGEEEEELGKREDL